MDEYDPNKAYDNQPSDPVELDGQSIAPVLTDEQLSPDLQDQPLQEKSKKKTIWWQIWEWVKVIVSAVVIGLLITTFVMQRNTVSGVSMLPTLQPSDELLVEKVSKLWGGVSRGDIITVHMDNPAFRDGEANIIKRVIGLPGDEIKIEDGYVFVNGKKLDERYLGPDTVTNSFAPLYSHLILGDDQYYVMGDNRSRSLDSRRFGPIKKSDIIGEVLIRFLPLDAIGVP